MTFNLWTETVNELDWGSRAVLAGSLIN